jgi:hypothetical protein
VADKNTRALIRKAKLPFIGGNPQTSGHLFNELRLRDISRIIFTTASPCRPFQNYVLWKRR